MLIDADQFYLLSSRPKRRDLIPQTMGKSYYIYILINDSGTLYIGITSNLIKRLWEHKSKIIKGFTEKYNMHKLIHYEIYEDPEQAILREKQLKKWSRKKKLALVKNANPKFEELVINE